MIGKYYILDIIYKFNQMLWSNYIEIYSSNGNNFKQIIILSIINKLINL